MSEVRGGGQEEIPHAPRPRPGVVGGRSYPMPLSLMPGVAGGRSYPTPPRLKPRAATGRSNPASKELWLCGHRRA